MNLLFELIYYQIYGRLCKYLDETIKYQITGGSPKVQTDLKESCLYTDNRRIPDRSNYIVIITKVKSDDEFITRKNGTA